MEVLELSHKSHIEGESSKKKKKSMRNGTRI